MSNSTSDSDRPQNQRRVRRRRNIVPGLISVFFLGGLVATGMLIARGYFDPLNLPSGDLRAFLDGPGEMRDQDINFSDQDMRNWRVDLYDFETDSIAWRANGDRAWPDEEADSPYAFRYENMTIKVAADPSKARSPDTIIRSPQGRADFTPGQDVLFNLESRPGVPVEIIGQGFSMTAPEARLKVPAKRRADKTPEGDTLTQQAAAHEFPVDRLEVDAAGPVLLAIDAGRLRARDKDKKKKAEDLPALPPITVLAEGGLEIQGQELIVCRGPVTIEVPPGSLPERKKAKKSKEQKSALQKLLDKGLRIRCGRLTLTRPAGPKEAKEETKKTKGIARFNALFEENARIYATGETEPFGRADRLFLELYSAGPQRELLAALGGPAGALAPQRARLKTPEVYALDARGDVRFEGEIEAREDKKAGKKKKTPAKLQRFRLRGEHLIWRSGEGYARLDGGDARPAHIVEEGGGRGIQAQRLESLYQKGRAFLAAQGAVDARALERGSELRIQADRLRLRRRRERDEDKGAEKKDLALDQAQAWGHPGAPAVITRRDSKTREEQRFAALELRLSSRERRMELEGEVSGLRRAMLEPGKDGKPRSNAVELSGERAIIDFVKDPFRMFGEAKGEKEAKKGPGLEGFRSIELRGAPALIKLAESGRPPIQARGARALWRSEDQTARLMPSEDGRVSITGEGGLYLEADTASWRQRERFLRLEGRPKRRVLVRDGQNNRVRAVLVELSIAAEPELEEWLESRALEMVIDLYDAVEILSQSGAGGLKDSLKAYGEGSERPPSPKGPRKGRAKKKSAEAAARPVELFAERGRLRLLEGPDEAAGYAVTGMDLWGAPGSPVRVRGLGDKPSDRFRLEAPSLTATGDERDRLVRASSAPGQALPLLWTEAGDRFQGAVILARLRKQGERETARIRFPEGADGLINIPQKDPEAEPNPLRFRSSRLWFEIERGPEPKGPADDGLDREARRARRRQQRLSSMRRLEAEDRVYFEDEGYVGEGDRLELDGASRTMVIYGRPARVRQKGNSSEVVQARISVAWKELLDED